MSKRATQRRASTGSVGDWEPLLRPREDAAGSPSPVQARRTERGFEILMALPGYEARELEVSYEGGVVTVNGQNSGGSVHRSFFVPEDVQDDWICAVMRDGVLNLLFQASAPRRVRRIPVDGSP